MLELYIGNKNYSSWSMRSWVLLKQFDIAFKERWVPFGKDGLGQGSQFNKKISIVSPTGKVPVLVDTQVTLGGEPLVIGDTLAIMEYVSEKFTDKAIYPRDAAQRAYSRSLCAEMHAGFTALRGACMMNIDADLPQIGAIIVRDNQAVQKDIQRIDGFMSELLDIHSATHKDGMLFGAFSAVDAYFSPVCMRIHTYHLPVSHKVRAYIDRIYQMLGVKAWVDAALEEKIFLNYEEPYRLSPNG